MGDRANVKVVEGNSKVFLYTHWRGSELPKILQQALSYKERWTDNQYLARIIFQEMLGDDTGTMGFGISSTVGDGEDRVLTVNVDKQEVSVANPKITWSFEEYLSADTEKVWYD